MGLKLDMLFKSCPRHPHNPVYYAVFACRYRAMNDVVSQAGKQTAQQEEGDADSPRGRGRGAPPVLPSLLWDLTRSQLLEPTLAEDLVQFSMISVSASLCMRL